MADASFDREQLRTLHEVGKVVTASLDLDATLGAIVEAAQRLTGAQLLGILLLEDDEHLVIRVGRGDVAAAVGERVRADQGIVGRALLAQQPVLVPDMLAEEDRARPDLDARSGLRTYFVMPLVWRGEPLGAVTVGSAEPAALSPTQAALIRELAELAAAAVAHARDYAREQTRPLEIESLYRELAERTTALERAQKQLVQNEKLAAIGELAHGIAHELNTPLGVILSNLSVLRQYGESLASVAASAQGAVEQLRITGEPNVQVADTLEASLAAADLGYVLDDLPLLLTESTASAERIAAIVRSVATFARRDADRVAPVDLEETLETAVTLAWGELMHGAELVRTIAGVPHVLGHASELTQVFVHLLLNAAQALDQQPGSITIATETDQQGAVVTISDTGCGVAFEHLPRIFDPFFTTRPPGRGTGMGLAVCHGIVTRHNGTIALESTPGRGTRVTVRLPATVGEAVAA